MGWRAGFWCGEVFYAGAGEGEVGVDWAIFIEWADNSRPIYLSVGGHRWSDDIIYFFPGLDLEYWIVVST